MTIISGSTGDTALAPCHIQILLHQQLPDKKSLRTSWAVENIWVTLPICLSMGKGTHTNGLLHWWILSALMYWRMTMHILYKLHWKVSLLVIIVWNYATSNYIPWLLRVRLSANVISLSNLRAHSEKQYIDPQSYSPTPQQSQASSSQMSQASTSKPLQSNTSQQSQASSSQMSQASTSQSQASSSQMFQASTSQSNTSQQSQASSSQAIRSWRELRREQDEEFFATLRVDQEKVNEMLLVYTLQ